MYVRPTVGASYVNMNNSINQRFTASSRLVPGNFFDFFHCSLFSF